MRPSSIVQFQWAYLAFILISLVGLALGWDAAIEQATIQSPEAAPMIQPMMISFSVIAYGISLLLWWLAAWKRSTVAKWFIVIFFAFNLIGLIYQLATGGIPEQTVSLAITLVVQLLNAYAVFLLFRPDASAWFAGTMAGSEPIDPIA